MMRGRARREARQEVSRRREERERRKIDSRFFQLICPIETADQPDLDPHFPQLTDGRCAGAADSTSGSSLQVYAIANVAIRRNDEVILLPGFQLVADLQEAEVLPGPIHVT
jgi:hypothetical protein